MRYEKHTKERLEDAVEKNVSVCGVMKTLGLKPIGGNHTHITKRIKQFDIPTTHFTGKSYLKGRKALAYKNWDAILIDETGTAKSRRGAYQLRRALIECGIKYSCQCGNDGVWMGSPITLEIHHKNGNVFDNRIQNLQFMCPNCHSQV